MVLGTLEIIGVSVFHRCLNPSSTSSDYVYLLVAMGKMPVSL